MDLTLFITVLLFIITSFYSIISYAELTPYLGFDFGTQYCKFQSGYGDNLFEEVLPVGNIFAGIKLNKYFGIEGGYETTTNEKRESTLFAGDQNLGLSIQDLPGFISAKYNSENKISGWHLGLTGEFPLSFIDDQNNLSIIWYLGIKNTKVRLIRNKLEVNGVYSRYTDNLNINNKKNIARLSGGLQYLLNDHLKFRMLLNLENTSKIKPYAFNASNSIIQAKLKDVISYNMGIVIK